MDLTSILGTLLSGSSINGISNLTGADSESVQSILGSALPIMMNGAQAQSQGNNTAASFANALLQHGQNDPSNVNAFLQNVDLNDGSAILSHLFGGDTEDKEELQNISNEQILSIAQQNGTNPKQTALILAAAAALLMCLLGKAGHAHQNNQQNTQQYSQMSSGSLMNSLMGNSNIGSIIGTLLGNRD